jgi:hypothetical protein
MVPLKSTGQILILISGLQFRNNIVKSENDFVYNYYSVIHIFVRSYRSIYVKVDVYSKACINKLNEGLA